MFSTFFNKSGVIESKSPRTFDGIKDLSNNYFKSKKVALVGVNLSKKCAKIGFFISLK